MFKVASQACDVGINVGIKVRTDAIPLRVRVRRWRRYCDVRKVILPLTLHVRDSILHVNHNALPARNALHHRQRRPALLRRRRRRLAETEERATVLGHRLASLVEQPRDVPVAQRTGRRTPPEPLADAACVVTVSAREDD